VFGDTHGPAALLNLEATERVAADWRHPRAQRAASDWLGAYRGLMWLGFGADVARRRADAAWAAAIPDEELVSSVPGYSGERDEHEAHCPGRARVRPLRS
jgi:hypothetical protein